MRKGGRDTAERKPNDYQLKQKSGMKSRDIVHYANTNECILTVVIDRFSHWMLPGENMNGGTPGANSAAPWWRQYRRDT